jgi:hypothetical protein
MFSDYEVNICQAEAIFSTPAINYSIKVILLFISLYIIHTRI